MRAAKYQNKLEEAKVYGKEALALLPFTRHHNVLEARLSTFLSSLHREAKRYEKAREWNERSLQVALFVTCPKRNLLLFKKFLIALT